MTFRIKHNSALSMSIRHLSRLQRERAETMEQISSAKRTSRAKYDAAGSAVVSHLDAIQGSKRQALRNLNDGLSLLNVAEGGLNEISDMVKRMRELAVQSASETLADTERQYLQNEYAEITSEITRTALGSVWGDKQLLSFQRVDVGFVVDGSASMPQEMVAVKNALTAFKTTLHDAGIDVGLGLIENSKRDAVDSTIQLADIDDGHFISQLTGMTTTGGRVDPWAALMNASGAQDIAGTLESDALSWTKNGKAKVLVSITDTNRETDVIPGTETQQDVADALKASGIEVHSINKTTFDSDYSTITATTGGSIHDIGNNSGSGIAAAMDAIATRVSTIFGDRGISVQASHGAGDASRIELNMPVNATAGGLGLDLTSVGTESDARAALETIDEALNQLNGHRSLVGSYTNRLESAISLETNALEQTALSQSRIEDTDIAHATARLARQQILQQAGLAVLGQVKGMHELALQLI